MLQRPSAKRGLAGIVETHDMCKQQQLNAEWINLSIMSPALVRLVYRGLVLRAILQGAKGICNTGYLA